MDKIYILILLLVLVVFHLVSYDTVHKNGAVFYDALQRDPDAPPQIYDIIHENLPDLSKYAIIPNKIFIGILLGIMVYAWNKSLGKEFLGFMLVVMFLRDITMNLTIFPKDCKSNKHKKENPMMGGSYDKLFSGHFAFCLLASLLFFKYGVITNIPLLVAFNVINAFLIVATHSHYTVDVAFSLFVTLFLFQNDIKVPL